jgi:AcrR family transcriptional regulator
MIVRKLKVRKMTAGSKTRRAAAGRDLQPPRASGDDERRRDGSRAAILEAAARLFRDRGYVATTLRDIGEAVGMKAGSIYYHFGSKDEILAEVLDLGIVAMHRAVAEAVAALPPDASAVERIETAIQAHLAGLLQYGAFTSANVRIYGQVPAAAKERHAPVRQAYADYWTKLLSRARREGVVRRDINLKMLRLLLLGSMNWTVEWYRPQRGSVAGIARAVQKLFLEGTLTPRAQGIRRGGEQAPAAGAPAPAAIVTGSKLAAIPEAS